MALALHLNLSEGNKMKSLKQRFKGKTRWSNGCKIWTGTRDADGYGNMVINNVRYRSHRVAYEMRYGTIPKGKWILHKCDKPACVNPNHLYAGTALENNRDAVNRKRHRNSKKTHCKRGHKLLGENLNIRRGQRECIKCTKERSKTYMKEYIKTHRKRG